MNKVLICHPGLQHSHQFALALYEANLLGSYISGVPVKATDDEWKWLPTSIRSKIKTVAIPKSFRRHPIFWQLLFRVGGRFGNAAYKHDFSHKVFHRFDDWMAKEVLRVKPAGVICFENSAASTFEAAKSVGAKCILDAPSIHYQAGEKLIDFSSNGYLTVIKARKDKELALADVVITCSSYGASTYVDAGVSPSKMRPLLLGADLPKGVAYEKNKSVMRFIFAGAMRRCKSIDLILLAFKKLCEEGANVELFIVGGSESADWISIAENIENVTYVGAVSQRELYNYLSESDCLLLPSRFDAFGMVVAEAMAAGIPAIVSSTTGAKEMIEKFPGSGWIINADEQSIYNSVINVVEGHWNVKEAAKHALLAAKYFTWKSYRQRVSAVVEEVLCG